MKNIITIHISLWKLLYMIFVKKKKNNNNKNVKFIFTTHDIIFII